MWNNTQQVEFNGKPAVNQSYGREAVVPGSGAMNLPAVSAKHWM